MIRTTVVLYTLLPFTLLAYFLLRLTRIVVKIWAKLIRPDLFAMLDANDAIFTADGVHICPRNTVVVTLDLKEENHSVDVVHIRNLLKINLLEARNPSNNQLLYPELQCNIEHWMGYPFLVKVPVAENYGVQEYNNEGYAMSPTELDLLKAKLTFQPFPKNGPLWELVVVQKVFSTTQGGSHNSVIIVRLHHSLTDGYGTMELFTKLLQQPQENESMKVSIPAQFGSRNPIRYLYGPYEFAKYLHMSSTTTGHFLSQDLGAENNAVAMSSRNSPADCAKRLHFAQSDAIPFSRIRELGKKHAVSATAVLHSAITGAISTALFQTRGKLSTPTTTVLVRTMLPLPWGRRKLLGNHVSVGFYSVDLSEQNVLKRLQLIQNSLTRLKESAFPAVMGFIIQFIGSLPRRLQGAFFRAMGQSDNVMYLTSVPGPRGETQFCGYDVKEVSTIAGWVMEQNGPWIVFMTVGDQLKVGLFGNRDILQNEKAQEVIKEFTKQLDALDDASAASLDLHIPT